MIKNNPNIMPRTRPAIWLGDSVGGSRGDSGLSIGVVVGEEDDEVVIMVSMGWLSVSVSVAEVMLEKVVESAVVVVAVVVDSLVVDEVEVSASDSVEEDGLDAEEEGIKMDDPADSMLELSGDSDTEGLAVDVAPGIDTDGRKTVVVTNTVAIALGATAVVEKIMLVMVLEVIFGTRIVVVVMTVDVNVTSSLLSATARSRRCRRPSI